MDSIEGIYADALHVACRHCNAQPGQLCQNSSLDNRPPTRIPHPCRLLDAQEVPF